MSGQTKIFLSCTITRSVLEPTQTPLQGVLGTLSFGLWRPRCEADIPLSIAEAKSMYRITSTSIKISMHRKHNFDSHNHTVSSSQEYALNRLLVHMVYWRLGKIRRGFKTEVSWVPGLHTGGFLFYTQWRHRLS